MTNIKPTQSVSDAVPVNVIVDKIEHVGSAAALVEECSTRNYRVLVNISTDSEKRATAVRDELAASIDDARDSAELDFSFDCSVGGVEAVDVSAGEDAFIKEARELYVVSSDDNISIHEDAVVSESNNGAWVSAWVWVPAPAESGQAMG